MADPGSIVPIRKLGSFSMQHCKKLWQKHPLYFFNTHGFITLKKSGEILTGYDNFVYACKQ